MGDFQPRTEICREKDAGTLTLKRTQDEHNSTERTKSVNRETTERTRCRTLKRPRRQTGLANVLKHTVGALEKEGQNGLEQNVPKLMQDISHVELWAGEGSMSSKQDG